MERYLEDIGKWHLMSGKKGRFEPSGLTISYKELGTVSMDEWIDAFVEDMKTLKAEFNVAYVKVPRIKMYVTNEYGEEVKLCRPGGGNLHFMYTNHYRPGPACMDYELWGNNGGPERAERD